MPINEAGKVIDKSVKMRARDGMDHYPTPDALARAAVGHCGRAFVRQALDPGAGTGPWGRAIRDTFPDAHRTAVELANRDPLPLLYHRWIRDDFLTWDAKGCQFDLICGNPPYRLAEAFIRRALSLLAPEGVLVLLLRLAFAEGRGRYRRLWQTHPLDELAVCVERPSYTLDGKTDATAYGLFYWRPTPPGAPRPTRLTWLSWKPDPRAVDPAQTQMFGED